VTVRTVEVPGALDGERVDRVVSFVTGLARAEASLLIDAGAVLLRGSPVKSRSRRVASGDRRG
jgi:RNA-binding protein YlmH